MAIENKDAYGKARAESEPEFAEILKKHGFSNVQQGTDSQDMQHIDIIATKDSTGSEWTFDVKDLGEWKGKSDNYNIKKHLIDEAKANRAKYLHHVHACRLYHPDGRPTGEYACFKTLDIIDNGLAFSTKNRESGKSIWLFNVKRCEHVIKHWRIK